MARRERHLLAAAIGAGVLAVVGVARALVRPRASKLPAGERVLTLLGRRVWTLVPEGGSRRVVVYFHGHFADVTKLGPALSSTFAKVADKPTILMPQLGPKSEPGELAHEDGVRDLLTAFYATFGAVPEVHAVDVLAHSGGYLAAAAALERGGVEIPCVGLLDSLYGEVPTFEDFALHHARHFANVFHDSTAINSTALGKRLVAQLGARASFNEPHTFDRQAATFYSAFAHDAIPGNYIVELLNAFAKP